MAKSSLSFPKISIQREERISAPVDFLAKSLLDPDDYESFKKPGTKDEELQSHIKRYLTYNLDKLTVLLHIENAAPEIANALQRAATTEQDGYGLDVEYTDIHTNDESMNKVELMENIHILPLRNGINEEEMNAIELSLNIKNTTNHVLAVLAGDISVKGYKLKDHLFYNNTPLIYLNVGKSVNVNNIMIKRGNTADHTRYLTAVNGSIWPLDRKAGAKTPNSTPMKHEIRFTVNAISKEESSKKVINRIMTGGCENLIERLKVLLQIVHEDNLLYLQKYDNLYVLKIEETNGIAKLLERVCYTLFPEVEYITAEVIYDTKIMTLQIKGSDAKNMLLKTIMRSVEIFENIQKQFN